MLKAAFKSILTFAIALVLGWFALLAYPEGATAQPSSGSTTAEAVLSDPSGDSSLSGQVRFTETKSGLQIAATVENAPPGYHGIHIHEKGSCAEAGNAAGGHYNPAGVKHGKLLTDGFENAHAGDLGNILILQNGTGTLTQTIPGLSLTEGQYAIADRAVILHANRDDFGQPTGNAGGRIGCGTVSFSKM